MLEANKNAVFEKIFSIYNRNLLKRRFEDLRVLGLEYFFNKDINIPLIIYCNHSSWWDGLVAFQISVRAALDSYLMMEEKQLRKYFLFRLLGAFSVVREKPREAYKSIAYASRLLTTNPRRTVWIFPQGEIMPNDRRPVTIFPGLAKIVEKTGKCRAAALAIRYEFFGEFKPQIFVRIEEPQIFRANEKYEKNVRTAVFAERLTENLDRLKDDVIRRNLTEYKTII